MICERERLRAGGKKVVFTNGCFDMLHDGHVRLLNKAKELGDILIVGLNSDSSVSRLKPNRPIIPEASRMYMLENLRCVDYVVVFSEDTPIEAIIALTPDVHVKGGDYKVEDLPETKIVQKYGGEVAIIDSGSQMSTSYIIKRIKNES